MELTWENLENAVRACRDCGLCERRLHTVLGEGNPHAGVLFVGEGPGRPDLRIPRERGIWVEKKGTLILPTYHPSALLRDETGQKKREAWQDLKSLREKMREMDLYPKEEKTWTQ